MKQLLSCLIFALVISSPLLAFAQVQESAAFNRSHALVELKEFRQNSVNLPKEAQERLDAAIQDLENAMRMADKCQSPVDEDLLKFKRSPAYCFLSSKEQEQLEKLSKNCAHGLPDDLRSELIRNLDRLRGASELGGNVPADIRRGDLIFRTDITFLSHCIVRASSSEQRFSHVGVITHGGAHPKILSVDYSESGGASLVSEVSWRNFFRSSVDAAVYRCNGEPTVGERIAKAAEKRIGIPFDPAFDLKTKDRLYCSELVRDAVNEAVGKTVIGTTKKGTFEYVAIDDCYRAGWIKVYDAKEGKQ